MTTERWRVCEAWFSPAIAGVDSAGVGEVLQSILAGFEDERKQRLAQVRTCVLFDTCLLTSHIPECVHHWWTLSAPGSLRPTIFHTAPDSFARDEFADRNCCQPYTRPMEGHVTVCRLGPTCPSECHTRRVRRMGRRASQAVVGRKLEYVWVFVAYFCFVNTFRVLRRFVFQANYITR
jgi:hypothetical protein